MSRCLLGNVVNKRFFVILAIVMGLRCVMAMAQEASPVEVVAAGGNGPLNESRGKFLWGPTAGFDIFAMEKTFGPMRRHNGMGFGVSAGMMMRYLYDNRWFVDGGLNFAYQRLQKEGMKRTR